MVLIEYAKNSENRKRNKKRATLDRFTNYLVSFGVFSNAIAIDHTTTTRTLDRSPSQVDFGDKTMDS